MTRLLATLLIAFLALHSGVGAFASFGGAWEMTAMTEVDTTAAVRHLAPGPASLPGEESAHLDGLDRCCGSSVHNGHGDGHCLDGCNYLPEATGFDFADPVTIRTATAVRAARSGPVGGPYRPPIH